MRLPDLLSHTLPMLCSHTLCPQQSRGGSPCLPAEWLVGPQQSLVLTKRASSVQAEDRWFAGQSPAFLSHPLASCGDLVLGEQGGGGDLTAHRPCPRLDSSVRSLLGIWPSKQGTQVSVARWVGAVSRCRQPVCRQAADHAPGGVPASMARSCSVHILPVLWLHSAGQSVRACPGGRVQVMAT